MWHDNISLSQLRFGNNMGSKPYISTRSDAIYLNNNNAPTGSINDVLESSDLYNTRHPRFVIVGCSDTVHYFIILFKEDWSVQRTLEFKDGVWVNIGNTWDQVNSYRQSALFSSYIELASDIGSPGPAYHIYWPIYTGTDTNTLLELELNPGYSKVTTHTSSGISTNGWIEVSEFDRASIGLAEYVDNRVTSLNNDYEETKTILTEGLHDAESEIETLKRSVQRLTSDTVSAYVSR